MIHDHTFPMLYSVCILYSAFGRQLTQARPFPAVSTHTHICPATSLATNRTHRQPCLPLPTPLPTHFLLSRCLGQTNCHSSPTQNLGTHHRTSPISQPRPIYPDFQESCCISLTLLNPTLPSMKIANVSCDPVTLPPGLINGDLDQGSTSFPYDPNQLP